MSLARLSLVALLAAGAAACERAPEATVDAVEAVVAPSFDCAAERLGEVETLICADPGLARLDLRMDSVWTLAMAKAEAGGMPEEDLADVRAWQRGWIGGRNECWKAPSYAAFESVPEEEAIRQCVELEYTRRIARLEAEWAIAEVTAGPVFWMCEGNPADEFVTTFYDTRPQTARVERGDQTEIMLRERTASGERYNGVLGRWFWAKGDSSMFSWPEGETRRCAAQGR